MTVTITAPVVRKTEEGFRQRWKLNWAKSKKKMLKLIGNREKWKQ